MPQVYNGIGTWYWGKTNIRSSRGTCQFCKKTGELKSYDTTKFFVVVFVPLLSLGQKRVMSECPYCKRHLVLPLKKYNEIRQQEVGAAIDDYRKTPNDPAKAAFAVSKAIGCEDEDQFLTLAEELERTFPRDASIQARLGGGYAFFGHGDQAEAAYARSYQLSPDPEVGDMLAVLYLRQGRADDAAPFLQHVLDGQERDKLGYVYLLAEGYQAAGRHDDALPLLERVAVAFPGIESNPEFNKYRAISLKNRASGKVIQSENLKPVGARVIERRPLAVLIPRLVAPALAILAFCIYLLTAIERGHSREVWFVNGLDRPYDVDVNGRHVRLGAMAATAAHFPEGDLNIKSLDPTVPIPAQTCRVTTPFSSRPFLNRTFVVNPDRAAIVYDEETTYSADTHSGNQINPHHMYVGDLLYTFSDIDYPFGEFPQSITVSDKTGTLHKKKVANWKQGSPIQRIGVIEHEIGHEAVGVFARNLASCSPGDPQMVLVASAVLPPEEALAFLRPQLGTQPIQVEWHRAYQRVMERAHPEVDLAGEYRAMLARDPQNSTLMYLLGRVAPDRNEELQLFTKATQGPSPCAYGYFAMSYDAMSHGDYSKALDLLRSALKLSPENLQFKQGEEDALRALGKYDDLLARRREELSSDPTDQSAALAEAQLLALQGHGDQAREVISSFVSGNSNSSNAREMKLFQVRGDALIHYAAGDTDGFASSSQDLTEDPSAKFEIAIATNRPEDAAAAMEEMKSDVIDQHLLVYITAAKAGRTDLAAAQLKSAADALARSGKEESLAARFLTLSPPPADPQPVCDLNLLPEQKRLVLTAMGLHDPAHREAYFKTAAVMNYDRAFPYLTLKKILDESATASR